MKILKSDVPGLAGLFLELGLSTLYEEGDYYYFQFHHLLKRNTFDWKELDSETRGALSSIGMIFSTDNIAIGENEASKISAKKVKANHLREHAKLRSKAWKEASTKEKFEFQEIISKNIESANDKVNKAIALTNLASIHLVKMKIFEIIDVLKQNEKITTEQQKCFQTEINNAYLQLNTAITSNDPKKINIAKDRIVSVHRTLHFGFFITPTARTRQVDDTSSKPVDSKMKHLKVPQKSDYSIKPPSAKNLVFTPSKEAISKSKTHTLPTHTMQKNSKPEKIDSMNNPPGGMDMPITPPSSPSTPPRRAG